MTNIYHKALLGSLFAVAVSGCASEAEPDDPVVQEMAEALPEITPEEEALIAAGDDASAAAEDDTSEMISGSNDKDARQPDPKRTKLIKTDPN